MSLKKYFDNQEYRWVWGYALILIILTTIPYILGYACQNETWRFSGFIFGVEDGNSYIAKMLSGARGDWLFRSPYTAMNQTGALAFLPYILLGKLTSLPGQHEQLVALFQLYRCLAIVFFVFVLYDFVSRFIKAESLRRFAVILASIGGGFGFLAVFGYRFAGYGGLPLEFYSPESFGFLAILGLPHLVAARACLLAVLNLILDQTENKSVIPSAIKAGMLLLILGLFQPLTVVVVWALLAISFIIEFLADLDSARSSIVTTWKKQYWKFKYFLWIGIFSSPIPIYSFLSFTLDPFLKAWTSQNIILSPPVIDYILAYGLILPFSLWGSVVIYKNKHPGWQFFIAWLVLFPLLAYAPYNLQRRLPEGIWVALSVLAVYAFSEKPHSWASKLKLAVCAGFASTFLIWAGAISLVFHPGAPVFVHTEAVAAYQFLDGLPSRSVVMADFDSSNPLPAWAYKRTVTGHGPESIGNEELKPLVDDFLAGVLPAPEAWKLLDSNSVEYFMTTPVKDSDKQTLLRFGEIVYDAGGYTVYRVK